MEMACQKSRPCIEAGKDVKRKKKKKKKSREPTKGPRKL